KVVKVYELNETKPVVTGTVITPPVVEQQDAPAVIVTETAVTQEQPAILVEEEETYNLFDLNTETEETPASEHTIEFEVTREEQKLPEVELQEETVVEQKEEITYQPVAEVKTEEYVVYTKKSYENDLTTSVTQDDMSRQLEDRKKILAGLSYR